VVASLNTKTGGPSVSVSSLARELARLGQKQKLVSYDYSEHGPTIKIEGVEQTTLPANFIARYLRGWSPEFEKNILALATSSDLVHNHGIWMFPNHYAAKAARQRRKPLVTSPRGMLGTWALSYHSLPKKILWSLRERNDLRNVTAFHATSQVEADDIRRLGFAQPIAVIPNGVDLPTSQGLARKDLEKELPSLQGRRLALFISRIHPKKGLLELVDAWAALPMELHTEWALLIAGPDLTNHLVRVEARILARAMEKSILLHPPVTGLLKQTLLKQAELFILPSHEENFGIVVAEALAHGTPVITTHGTPWEILKHNKCGWWIPMSVDSLRQTLATALLLPPPALAAMGLAGKDYTSLELSWSAIAQKMSLFYAWILSGGPPPSFVRTD